MSSDDDNDNKVGPNRFAPSLNELSTAEQIDLLDSTQRECFDYLKSRWNDKKYPSEPYNDEMILRFARCSPGATKFNSTEAWKVMKKFDRRYLTLKASDIEEQLSTKTLFPIPGLKTSNGGYDIFYMRPSRYYPRSTSTQTIIDNLAYCMTAMTQRSQKSSSEGIGFLAYMKDWKFDNFSIKYCYNFMMMLQGRIPVRLRLFLIVNPPHWFDTIWSIMKPMLSKEFRKKVYVIPEEELNKYLADDYKTYLPDEMSDGQVNTDELVKDYITYRKSVEEENE